MSGVTPPVVHPQPLFGMFADAGFEPLVVGEHDSFSALTLGENRF